MGETEQRYLVHYGDLYGSIYRYCVWDLDKRERAFESDAKSEVIAQAQRLNGFKPVDGSEATYHAQTHA